MNTPSVPLALERVSFFRRSAFAVFAPAVFFACGFTLPDAFAKTPASIAIIGSAQVAEGSAEPYFARVTYTDASRAVVTAIWTDGFDNGAVSSARIFTLGAPSVAANRAETLSVSYTEDAATVTTALAVTVLDAPLTGPGALETLRRETERRPRSRAGYSVDAATGAHVIEKTAMSLRATVEMSLDLTFNSLFTQRAGPLGPGWRHNYDLRLTGDPETVLVLHDGPELESRFRYLETINGIDHYVPLDPANRHDVLTRDTNSGGSYELITFQGLRLNFSKDGLLVDYRNKVRQGATLAYSNQSGEPLLSVRESLTLRGFNFAYDAAGRLQTVRDADDRFVRFRYDAGGRLASITQPYYVDATVHGTGTGSIPIPDNDPVGMSRGAIVDRTAPIGEVIFAAGMIDHSRFEDLVVTLTSPAGTQVLLRDRQPHSSGRLELTGLSLDDFHGENPEGVWALHIVDTAAGVAGEAWFFRLKFSTPHHPTRYTYDAENRIIAAHDATGARLFATTFDSAGRVATQDDGVDTNAITTFTYTNRPDGRLETTYKDRVGAASTFVHDAGRRLLNWTDPLGHDTAFTYDRVGNLTALVDALKRTTRFEYDASGNIAAMIDPAGNTTRMFYDAARNLTRLRDALGKETRFEYDGINNLTRVTDAASNVLVKTYNLRSQLLSTKLHDGSQISYGYDSNGDLSYATHPVDPAQRSVPKFDKLGRITQLTDASKFITKFEYSPTGEVTRETDYRGDSIQRIYDARDRVIEEIDKAGHRTTFAYDGNDNRVSVTDPAGGVRAYAYDGEDRLIAETDPLGHTTTTTYDALGRRLSVTDALERKRSFGYDAVGNLVAEYDSTGAKVLTRIYDERDLLTRVTDAFGHSATTEYDALGRAVKSTDALGRVTQYTYDELDRLKSVLDPLNRVVRKHYAADDMTTRIETPGAADTVFEYDAANRLTRISQGSFMWREFFYGDWRDLVTKEHTPSRTGINYEYDGLGRLLKVSGISSRNYTYDANGNMTASVGDGTITRTYDELNRITSLRDADGSEIHYAYDANGNLTKLTYPGGDAVQYAYDAADRLVRVTDWARRVTTFEYNADDQITRIGFPNGTRRDMTYDRGGQLLRRVDTAPGGQVIVGFDYSYDQAGQLSSQYALHAMGSYTPTPAAMTYNDRHQAITFNNAAITYDGHGNTNKTPTRDGLLDLSYLADGSLSRIGADRYEYDHEDRLVRIISAAGTTSLFTNPHAGLPQLLRMTEPDGTTTRFVYGLGLLYDVAGDSIRVYHYDHRGNTAALTDGGAAVSHRFGYGPFGEPAAGNDPAITPFLFGGLYGVFTEPHGLCHMRARFYSPFVRRFLSRDAYLGDVRIPGTLNPWSYALANPIAFDDPQGEWVNVLVGAIGGAIGGFVGQGVSDLIRGRPFDWNAAIGAAAGGAATGALIGSGAGLFAAGALGGALGNVTTQGLNFATGRQDRFNFGSFAVDTALGGVAGAAGGKFAKVTQGVTGTAWRKQVIYRGLLYDAKSLARGAAARQILTTVSFDIFVRGSIGAAKGAALRVYDTLAVGQPQVSIANRGRQRPQAVRALIEEHLREQKGEYVHYELYRQALSLAGLPLPASPNNTLTEF